MKKVLIGNMVLLVFVIGFNLNFNYAFAHSFDCSKLDYGQCSTRDLHCTLLSGKEGVCIIGDNFCKCHPVCGDTEPTCNGACLPTQVCILKVGGCQCISKYYYCLNSPAPQCGGECDLGNVCTNIKNSEGKDVCTCKEDCTNSDPDICDGACSQGEGTCHKTEIGGKKGCACDQDPPS